MGYHALSGHVICQITTKYIVMLHSELIEYELYF
jgi:hypothetical protein